MSNDHEIIGYTKINKESYDFTWVISDYLLVLEVEEGKIESPIFDIGNDHQAQFQFKLNKRKDAAADKVFLYLLCVKTNAKMKSSYKISVMRDDESVHRAIDGHTFHGSSLKKIFDIDTRVMNEFCSSAAPGRSSSEVLIGEVDIPMRDDNDIDGESSEETFSKKCIVRNKAYSHSQTIPSFDLNSHCLCVAGEVYCWWQTAQRSSSSDAPLTLSTESPPAPSTRKATTKNNDAWIDEDDDQDYSGSVSEQPQEAYQSAQQQQLQNINHPTDSSMEDEVNDDDDDDDEDDQDDAEEDDSYEPDDVDEDEEDEAKKDDKAKAAVASSPEVENSTAAAASTTAKTPATCLVMGRTYRAGEVLPHTTGNCVECSCGQQGRIECAPHDCVGLRPQRPGGGGGGSSNDLELFDLDRDPGIYESF
ncbi:hypothetical protein TKK_0004606 [Trichogramma kaykai]